jgi:1-acyl-sn-glycerol-3-phosphate acyltransferase
MGVPVVPVALCGTRDTLKKNSLVLKNHPLIVEVGAPIKTASLTFEDRQQYVANVQEAVVALKAKWQENG